MFCLRLLACLLALLAFVLSGTPAWANPAQGPRVVAYVPNWIDLTFFSATLDYTKVTHLNLAFENPVNDGGDLSFHAQDILQHRRRVTAILDRDAAARLNHAEDYAWIEANKLPWQRYQ